MIKWIAIILGGALLFFLVRLLKGDISWIEGALTQKTTLEELRARLERSESELHEEYKKRLEERKLGMGQYIPVPSAEILKKLENKMIEGDEIWEFETSEESWHTLSGRAGIALVRNGKVVWGHVTVLN